MTWVVRSALLVAFAISAAGCVFHRVEVQPVTPVDQGSLVGPVKAHLRDGSTVVYAPGVIVIATGQTLRGAGRRYDHTLTGATPVESVSLEEVVGMERFVTEVNRPATIATSLAASYGVTMSVLLMLFAVAVRGQ
jgi:hypothetical protein